MLHLERGPRFEIIVAEFELVTYHTASTTRYQKGESSWNIRNFWYRNKWNKVSWSGCLISQDTERTFTLLCGCQWSLRSCDEMELCRKIRKVKVLCFHKRKMESTNHRHWTWCWLLNIAKCWFLEATIHLLTIFFPNKILLGVLAKAVL